MVLIAIQKLIQKFTSESLAINLLIFLKVKTINKSSVSSACRFNSSKTKLASQIFQTLCYMDE